MKKKACLRQGKNLLRRKNLTATDYMIFKIKGKLNDDEARILKTQAYDVVGCIHQVVKEIPCGLPEYIYQEGLTLSLSGKGLAFHKEYVFHPNFMGKQFQSFMKMDFMVENPQGNIIIECKAISELMSHERHQLLSYMIATRFPIGILVNFAHYPTPEIEKYYLDINNGEVYLF